jgi:hypothetical protein
VAGAIGLPFQRAGCTLTRGAAFGAAALSRQLGGSADSPTNAANCRMLGE